MRSAISCLVASVLLFGACGGEDKEAPGNGDASGEPVAPGAAWKPGQKIPIDQMWASGSDGATREWAQSFGDWRGRPTTSSWINLLYLPWDWLATPGLLAASPDTDDDRVKVWDVWRNFQGPLALSMSMAGPSEVSQEEYDESMRQCATGAFDAYWRAFARNAKAAGRNGDNTIVSLAQEFNGTWFPWNPKTVGMKVWKDCWKHVYTAIHSESDLQVTWVFSANANTELDGDYAVANLWDAYPGDEYVDVLGLTRYDLSTLGDETSTDWRNTCGNDQDICEAARFAREHGKELAVVEWSIERDEDGHGDNPNFVQMMFGFFADNRDVLLLENNFNHYGDDDDNPWNLYPRQADNAKSSDMYRELYTP
jgi:hypothetical protein